MADWTLCEEPDCDRPVHSGGRYCAGHQKRIERGAKSSGPLREHLSLRERCLEKAIAIVNFEDDGDEAGYERAWDALEHALKDWHAERTRSRGGKSRWEGVSPEERSAIMRETVSARYRKAGLRAIARRLEPRPRKRVVRRRRRPVGGDSP